MGENPVVRDIGVIIIAAMVFVAIGRALRIPSIVAYILAGLTIGPVLGWVGVSEPIELISEMGIALLLFFVGLEISLGKVRDLGRVALITGAAQMAVTGGLGYALALSLGFSPAEALFLSTAVAFSSTVVAVKLFAELGGFQELYGRVALGVLLVQDLAVVVVLTFVAGLGGQGEIEAPASALALRLLQAFGGMALLMIGAVVAARRLLPRTFGWLSRSQEGLFIWSLCWCFLFVFAAQQLELPIEIGAFLAGISLAQLPVSADLRRRVHPLMNFFVAVFFVTLGIEMRPADALSQWPSVIALSLFVLVGKPATIVALLGRQGYGERTSFLAGLTLGQISEFSFVLGALALSEGLIERSTLSVVGAVGVLTMGVSSFLTLYAERLQRWAAKVGLTKRLGASGGEDGSRDAELRGHVIVVGMNTLGRRIVKELTNRGERTLAIDTDPAKLEGLPGDTLIGNVDYLSVLEEAGIRRAKMIVSAVQIEDTNRLLAYRARDFGLPSSVHAFDQSLVPELTSLGATHLMDSRAVGIERVMDALHDAGVYGS